MDDATLAFPPATARRVWTFGACRFDEARWSLVVDGAPVEIEAKPLEILRHLLARRGEVVSKAELMDAVWPGVTVVEGSLTTAISKLRKVLGETGGARVATVPRIGYRMDGRVSVEESGPAEGPAFATGAPVPQRPNWLFAERLGGGADGEVWRIAHAKTHATRVMKYAMGPERRGGLEREVAISRLLREALGERADLVAVLDWSFGGPAAFVESADGGDDLARWAAARGGAGAVSLPTRLSLLAQVAEAVAALHGLGVLHGDLKPANILVAPDGAGGWRARVADFGGAELSEPDRLRALGVTRTGFGMPARRRGSSGTPLWMAPELLRGGVAGAGADVYALGVMLYQLVVGDLSRPLAPGWEREVDDPVLRDDIGEAAAGDPARRLASAAEFARRLRDLPARRTERAAREAAAARAVAAEARLAQLRARRPWAIAAAALLVLGVLATSALYLRADRERDTARRQTAMAEKVNDFLARDLLARASPFKGASAGETLVDAVKASAPLIDRRFGAEPAVAARLHQTIANALDKRSDWPGARAEYDRAAALWAQADGASSPDLVATRLQQAMMEARTYEGGSLDRAKALTASAERTMATARLARPDLAVWGASARGMVALIGDDAGTAAAEFARAADGADAIAGFDPAARLTFRQRLAFAEMRRGDGAGAERQFRTLDRRFRALEGPDGPNVLMVGMNIAQTLMIQGRHAEAVAQANAVHPRLVARLGADHEMVLQLVTTRAQSEGVLERWDAAVRDDLAVHAAAVRKQGPKSFFAVASEADAATSLCRAGKAAEGLSHAEAALTAAKAGFGKAALTDAVAYARGACLVALGRYGDAAAGLQGLDRAAVAQLAGDPNWGANVDLALAQIAAAQGRPAEARRLLDASAHAYAAKAAEPYQVRLWTRLDRSTPKAAATDA